MPALPAKIGGVEWWSDSTGSLTIGGIDVVNITIETADTEVAEGLTIEEIDAARDWIVAVIAEAVAKSKEG